MAPLRKNKVEPAVVKQPHIYQGLMDLKQGMVNVHFESNWGELFFEFNVAGYPQRGISVKYSPETRNVTIVAEECPMPLTERIVQGFAADPLLVTFQLPVDASAPRATLENGVLTVVATKVFHDQTRDEQGRVDLPIDYF